ncbi:cysteine hydrolase family protein [Luteimonas kalidii]|uniref:Cysteine hydrolase n=1 Tax=Luteimonas kalidii TaxID=3042025 RepID=A0ABT6JUD0_9GAMM|nr:isochorismatase family cysteine hydrolase [Luteimonas kalidii]MDH5833556.1 cysteine hydrolase [Luteimonas kalidii]
MSAPGSRGPAALLVIDMINRLDFPGAERMAPGAIAAARRIQALRDRFHARDWPVIFANDNFADWRSDFRELVAMALNTDGAPATIAKLLAPDARDYVVLKPKHSAFLATPLPVLLAKLEVRRLLLTGLALESCVLATAADANAREFEVAIVRDAVAGLPGLRMQALATLAGSGTARLLPSSQALAWAGAGSA